MSERTAPEGITPKPGDIRYLDKNGDGVIKPDDDRFIVGNDFRDILSALLMGWNIKALISR